MRAALALRNAFCIEKGGDIGHGTPGRLTTKCDVDVYRRSFEDLDDEEETEQDRSSPQGRHRYRGGRPPKKIIEEWANDPYCE
jgi:hypothetical protein